MQALIPMPTEAALFRLRKHADYQLAYKASRKHFAKQMAFFFTLRTATKTPELARRAPNPATPRVGLTVGKVMGKAVDRNRIKRRMREAIRHNLPILSLPVDVILHPRRSVIDLDFRTLDRELAQVFRQVQNQARKQSEQQASSTADQP